MIWKNIKGYEGLYQISDEGEVRSLGNGNSSNSKERILKPNKDKDGYLYVILYKNGKKKTIKIHRLVAEAFISNPDNLPQVNHKNEDKTDNRLFNLEWCTNRYNSNHGTRNKRISEKKTNGKTSKPVKQFTLDGVFVNKYPSTSEVERKLGFANTNICAACLGKQKTAYGYRWEYA